MAVVGRPLFVRDVVAGSSPDLAGTVWIHWWVRTTTEAGDLPLRTDLLFHPDGKDFFVDTGANVLDAFLSIPLQWLLGVPDHLDALVVLTLVANAWAVARLVRALVPGAPAAAWGAAVLFEINPFVLQEIDQGRVTQAVLVFGLLALERLVRLEEGTWRDAALFGVFAFLQGLTYWYSAYFLVLAGLPLAVAQLARSPRTVAPRLALAVAVCLALASPFLVGIAREVASKGVAVPERVPWRFSGANQPMRWRSLAGMVGASWLVALAFGFATARRSWPLLAGVALTVGFAVGPCLATGGAVVENPLYVFLYEHVPYVARLGFPERVAAFGFPLLAAAAALGLARTDAVWAALLPAVALAEAAWRSDLPVQSTAWSFPPAVDIVAREGGAVFTLPAGNAEEAMVEQTRHGQPISGGMGQSPTGSLRGGHDSRPYSPVAVALADLDGPALAAAPPTARAAFAEEFRWIWLDVRGVGPSRLGTADLSAVVPGLADALGTPVYADDDTVLWDARVAASLATTGAAP